MDIDRTQSDLLLSTTRSVRKRLDLDRPVGRVFPVSTGRLISEDPAAAAAYYGSIVPAVWSFQLALRSRGLGSCYTTLHLMDEAACNEVLGMPDDVTAVALLPVAYTKGTDFRPAQRDPVERITFFNEWATA